MVLEKRKRDGGFEPWKSTAASHSPSKQPASVSSASSSQIQGKPGEIDDALPPAKKPRQDPTPVASSSMIPIPSKPPPAKRVRRKAGDSAAPDDALPSPEKRLAMFKKKCPQNIMDRVERVMTQRFFMVDRQRIEGELKEEFKVLGSTGNIYTVTIQHKPSCDCPDAQKGNHCKHIVRYSSISKVGFSSVDRSPPNAVANPRIREAYARATGKSQAPTTPEASSGPKKRIPGEEDDCPICYDNMHNVAEASLTFCEECGNAVHGECFAQWKQTSARTGTKLTCIYCRAAWPTPAATAARASGSAYTTAEGYINMSTVAGLSPQRDTSTYYHGPRRGQRYYGYNLYDDDY
ncbi:hypothetical protein MSAN_00420800 [Mycena sanguinolenta]|uniref:Uncharacterized protein n=1 Tax=Mycena sanguinolenta TaxID=230812 RepID=A0A8H6ZDD9_9AGAR|nr:hypothetical protein MSAN_00420800 [Mycena sanguinolenta]